ncbi:MAG: hypothetical protein M3Y48_16870 [Actinomycetota bacterium]|nr:hypothetical protein [Actinomycetota bacterium]
MSESPTPTGDPWIDAYLKLRRAWIEQASPVDLTAYARELRRDLPSLTLPPPAAMFIQNDIEISGITHELVTALWTPPPRE